jgi:hypothetical protein
MWGSAPFPHPVELSTGQPLLQTFLLQGYWAGAATGAFSLRLVYLQFVWGRAPSLSPELRVHCPLCYVSFFSAACLLFVFSFSPGQGQSVQGAIWFVHGSTTWCLFAHLVYPKQVRSWHLATWEPSWSLHLTWQGMLCESWGCGGVGILPLLGGFSCQVYLQCLSRRLL